MLWNDNTEASGTLVNFILERDVEREGNDKEIPVIHFSQDSGNHGNTNSPPGLSLYSFSMDPVISFTSIPVYLFCLLSLYPKSLKSKVR